MGRKASYYRNLAALKWAKRRAEQAANPPPPPAPPTVTNPSDESTPAKATVVKQRKPAEPKPMKVVDPVKSELGRIAVKKRYDKAMAKKQRGVQCAKKTQEKIRQKKLAAEEARKMLEESAKPVEKPQKPTAQTPKPRKPSAARITDPAKMSERTLSRRKAELKKLVTAIFPGAKVILPSGQVITTTVPTTTPTQATSSSEPSDSLLIRHTSALSGPVGFESSAPGNGNTNYESG
uniref:60S ribosomal protein L7 n=1 Tax=Panagrellus redivivus TaxID=6233 RepID=A0A7E4VVZ5_PANRE